MSAKELLDDIRKEFRERIELGDSRPEEGHMLMDYLCETVVRAVADGHPDATEAAKLVRQLLELEKHEYWERWYA